MFFLMGLFLVFIGNLFMRDAPRRFFCSQRVEATVLGLRLAKQETITPQRKAAKTIVVKSYYTIYRYISAEGKEIEAVSESARSVVFGGMTGQKAFLHILPERPDKAIEPVLDLLYLLGMIGMGFLLLAESFGNFFGAFILTLIIFLMQIRFRAPSKREIELIAKVEGDRIDPSSPLIPCEELNAQKGATPTLLVMTGIILLCASIYFSISPYHLAIAGSKTQVEILAVDRPHVGAKSERGYDALVQFKDRKEDEIETRLPVFNSFLMRRAGDRLTITYKPEDPENTARKWTALIWMPSLLCFFGGLIFLLSGLRTIREARPQL